MIPATFHKKKWHSFPSALMAMIFVGWASLAWAEAFPPQVPSPEDMARVQRDLAKSLEKVRAAQGVLDKVVRDYEAAEHRLLAAKKALDALQGPLAASQARQKEVEGQLEAAQRQINGRAASSYRTETLSLINVVLESRSFREFATRLDLLRSVIVGDSKVLLHTRALKDEAIKVREQVEAQKAAQERHVAEIAKQQDELDKKQDEVQGKLAAVGREYEAVRADLEKRKSGFSFPVKAPYSYVDTYGAPRMEGTAFYHRHEGTDIFALEGTPVLATVDGVLEAVGTARLGGIKLWLRSPGDNWTYYYAHLTGYAPGIANGVQVRKGDVLGYVGRTGNARGTPPHLHFEIHAPGGPPEWGPPTNPIPILRRIDPLKK